ncbi:hypothetical protein [Marinifilum flexuosum]|uniref:hypothetical protein n=1 Tax=Marinifilum flexuosum TaxID=1117708 RepID=UPI0024945DD5|nr:hypothetical protein [Marinifilum flexuosum]
MKNRSPSFEMGKVHPLSNKDPTVKLSVHQLIKNNSYNKKYKTMKTNTILYTLLIALFFISCDSSTEDFGQEEAQSSISIIIVKTSLKYGDDDNSIPDWPIKIEGKTKSSSNVRLESMPEFKTMDETTSNTYGVFYLEVEKPGEYLITVNHQDGFSEELAINLE